MTLKRYVRKCRVDPNTICKPCYVTKQLFTDEEEKELSDYLQHASKLHYGLSTKTTRKLAYDYAIARSKSIPDTWTSNKCAGKEWLRGFMTRRRELSLRAPEATSLARATAFNRHTVNEFFTNLREVRARHHYTPFHIYNVDETGLTTVQKPVKVIAARGSKQVGQITSAERGSLVTVCCAVNAAGSAIPPFFVFPRVHYKTMMTNGGPPGCVGTATPSGWMNTATFLQWMNHFIQHVKCSPVEPVLLLLDNHESHVSYDCLDLAKRSGITVLSFPPHCSHKLQPLDRSVYGPLKRYYNAACDDWLASNPRPMTIYDIAQVTNRAYTMAFSPANIIAGFRVSGIEPLNPDIFGDDEFMAASVTDRPLEPTVIQSTPGDVAPVVTQTETPVQLSVAEIPLPSTANDLQSTGNEAAIDEGASSSRVNLESIRPFPKAGARKGSYRGRQKQRTRILTDTPVREQLRAQQEKKGSKGKGKEVQKKMPMVKPNIKRKLVPSSDSSEDDDAAVNKLPSSDSDDDWSDIRPISDDEEDNETIKREHLKPDDYVIVILKGGKTSLHYIARIDKPSSEDLDVTVTYLEKTRSKPDDDGLERFFVPEGAKSYLLPLEDIVKKLPTPMISGGTKRVSRQIVFPIDLSHFKLGHP